MIDINSWIVAILALVSFQVAEIDTQAVRGEQEQVTYLDEYEKGNCESLANVFRNYGMTDDEAYFFFGRGILERESGCGRDTYNERTGDTGVCQLTHLHSKPGYFFGTYYGQGWAVELFGLYVGKAHGGFHKDHPNTVPACLWLLRGGTMNPGIINTQPWKATR